MKYLERDAFWTYRDVIFKALFIGHSLFIEEGLWCEGIFILRGEEEGGEGGALDFTMSERWMDDFAKLTQLEKIVQRI